jgi:hypothetical protein
MHTLQDSDSLNHQRAAAAAAAASVLAAAVLAAAAAAATTHVRSFGIAAASPTTAPEQASCSSA